MHKCFLDVSIEKSCSDNSLPVTVGIGTSPEVQPVELLHVFLSFCKIFFAKTLKKK